MKVALVLTVAWAALIVGLYAAMNASAGCGTHVRQRNVRVTVCVTTLRPGACRFAVHEFRNGVEVMTLRKAIPCIRAGEFFDPGDRRPL